MPIVYRDYDEWYPVHDIDERPDGYGEAVELTELQIAFVKEAFGKFEDAQQIIKSAKRVEVK